MDKIRKIIPILIAASWDEKSPGDKEIIELLTKKPYEDISAELTNILNEATPPIKRIGYVWKLISHSDSWQQYARFLTPQNLELFKKAALKVFKAIDPRYELPAHERWAAGIHGKIASYSEQLRDGMAKTLALLATQGESAGIQDAVRPQDRVRSTIYELLGKDTNGLLWSSLSDVLPTLAEAAPDVFLDAVEKGLEGEKPTVMEMFSEEGGISSHSPHTGLLWALEGLAWSTDYLSRVTLILGRLAVLDPGGILSNRPDNSLSEIFMGFMPQTTANLDERMVAVQLLLKHEPEIGWKILNKIIPGNNSIVTGIHHPEWRDWDADWKEEIPSKEVQECLSKVVKLLLSNVGNNGNRWRDLLEHLPEVPVKYRDEIIDKLDTAIKEISEEEKYIIWEKLREIIHLHHQFHDANWAMPKEIVDRLYSIYNSLEPVNFIKRYTWLFSFNPKLPEAEGTDWEAQDRALEKVRSSAINKVLDKGRLQILLDLAGKVENPYQLGISIGSSEAIQDVETKLIETTLGNDDRSLKLFGQGFVTGKFRVGGWNWVTMYLGKKAEVKLSALQSANFAIGLPAKSNTWDILKSCHEEAKKIYWKEFEVYFITKPDDIMRALNELLTIGRPCAAIELAGHSSGLKKTSAVSGDLLAKVLEQAATNPESEKIIPDSWKIERVFKIIDSKGDVEPSRIKQIEWLFLQFLTHGERGPKKLHEELKNNANFFAELVSYVYKPASNEKDEEGLSEKQIVSRARKGRELLRSLKEIPGLMPDGSVDGDKLKKWVKKVREECSINDRKDVGDQMIGQLLAHAPSDADGVWPHNSVRDVVDEQRSLTMDSGIKIGVYNKRGAYSKSIGEGGKQEREIASKYREWAKTMKLTWPRTASMLRKIAENYEADAFREDKRAELDKS